MSEEKNPIRIIVIDRGFVMVCRCPEPEAAGLWLTVTNARILRDWGTTEGLGELVNGPTTKTKMDKQTEEEKIPTRAILRIIKVSQPKWQNHLST